VAGTSDTFDLVPAPGIVTEEGTDINKAALLKDATAVKLGLNPTNNPTPDDAFNAAAIKVGQIIQSVGSAPSGYALCNGADYDIDEYPELGAVDLKGFHWQFNSAQGNPTTPDYGNGKYVYASGALFYSNNLLGPYSQGATWPNSNVDFVNGYFATAYFTESNFWIYYTTNPAVAPSRVSVTGYNPNYSSPIHRIVWTGTYYLIVTQVSNDVQVWRSTSIDSGWAQIGRLPTPMYYPYGLSIVNGYVVVVGQSSDGSGCISYCNSALVATIGNWASVNTTPVGTGGNSTNGIIYYDSTANLWMIPCQDSNTKLPYIYYSSNLASGWTGKALDSPHSDTGQFHCVRRFDSKIIAIYRSNLQGQVLYHASAVGGTWSKLSLGQTTIIGTYHGKNGFLDITNPALPKLVIPIGQTPSGGFISATRIEGSAKTLPTISLTGAYSYIRMR
jgi:hypothetical protein